MRPGWVPWLLSVLLTLTQVTPVGAADPVTPVGAADPVTPVGAADPVTPVGAADLVPLTTELDFPANLATAPWDRDDIYVVEHFTAEVRVLTPSGLRPEPFLAIADRVEPHSSKSHSEEGLLAIAFPPAEAEPRAVFVTYIARNNDLVLSRFRVDPSGKRADPDSEQVLLALKRKTDGHHCGHIAFGPHDGFLYLCIGDTDHQLNPSGSAQSLGSLRGKLIRIDVSGPDAYRIPPTNPFVDRKGRDEVFAYGLRNPWRFGFDPANGDLYLPDVGYLTWEELNYAPAGQELNRNFGWARAEANECLKKACAEDRFHWPLLEFAHGDGSCAIAGGAVYRGRRFEGWQGVYVFGDFCSGDIWALRRPGSAPELRRLARGAAPATAIAADADGEIIVASGIMGTVFRLALPSDPEAGWQPVAEHRARQQLAVLRRGATFANHHVHVLHQRNERLKGRIRELEADAPAP